MAMNRWTMGAGAAALLAFAGAAGMATAPHASPDMAASPVKVDDFQLADQDFLAHQMGRLKDAKAIVLVTWDSRSAAAAAAAPAINALKGAHAAPAVELFLLDSTPKDARPEVEKALAAQKLNARVLFDYEQLVGEQLGVTKTAEAIVIEPRTMRIAYRGAVDGAAAAVDALSAGKPVQVAHKPAAGDAIPFPARAQAASFQNISYAKTIAPMIQAKCATCHQPGGIGPMTLTSYEQVKGFSPMIREVVRTKRMPPYLADETVGHFTDDDRLPPDQIKTLVHWIEAGSPRGAGADPLTKIAFKAPEWPLGKPDLVVEVPAAEIPASGVMEYQRPVVKAVMKEGRWMKATTFRVTDRKVVHHILTGTIAGDDKKTASETEWGASLGGYGPGRGSNISPPDMGTWVPPSGGIGFQNHYTPYGKPTTEKTQMGLYFYPKGQEPKYVMRTMGVFDFSIQIPAGEEAHKEVAYLPFPKEAVIYGITPHAHVRGRSTYVYAVFPDGHEQGLLALPKYDFNWQYEYFLKTPLKVPPGTKIVTRWTYDNSDRNPGNPDSKHLVSWGEQTSEEMLAVYLHYRWTDETVKNQKPENDKLMQQGIMMGVYDDNLDGKLQKAELRGKQGEMLLKFWALVDKNKDGAIDSEELAAAMKLMPKRGQQQATDGIVPNSPAKEAPKPVTTASR